MSTGRRAYDLLRSYVNQQWDRVQDSDAWQAVQELDSPARGTPTSATEAGTPRPAIPNIPTQDPEALAASILGVPAKAPFSEVHRAFERLNKRADPARFEAGSQEQIRAAELQKRVNWAYQQLSQGVSESEKRFRSLEIE